MWITSNVPTYVENTNREDTSYIQFIAQLELEHHILSESDSNKQ
jgi:hypothetical protein